MAAPPKLFETEAILEAYRAERQRREEGEQASPLTRLAEALDLLAAGEGAAEERREASRLSRSASPGPITSKENPLSQRLLLIVEIAARPGRDEALVTELVAMERASRAEEGCREYTMLRSLSDPLRFVVYEIWQSAEHLEGHRHTPHYRAFGPVIAELVTAPPKLMEVPLSA